MTPRIRDIRIVNHRLDPHETELRVFVTVETATPDTEARGRLVGPRSVKASTIEISYPLRLVDRNRDESQTTFELRVVIPEANWWSPEQPFVYEGPVDIWQDGKVVEQRAISHGIIARQT
jgi:hypothetical protein